ncbi:rhodanese-like domain-containing protein [Nesterenkonia massiliensis]|uniref:rhodanese-like domain-containing protein n=1 Tax=Nesterenkonia massiliensis TaxID=1232429 RepID=UPI000416DA5B|nr:rhodanese-like domain-containing protein [Nesterenkonia massiliensis]
MTTTPAAQAAPMAPAELAEKIAAAATGSSEQAPLMVDVRTPGEYETLHIPGSLNIPLDLLQNHQTQLGEQLQGEVVLICQTGNRAQQALQLLRSAGVNGARVLEGGVVAFEASQHKHTARGTQRWAMDRQVRMVAGSLVLTGFLGSKLISPKLGYLAGAIGAGLTFSALSNTCAMASALSKMPWNRTAAHPTLEKLLTEIPRANAVQVPGTAGQRG